ncbi:putative protein farnesyltransferase alpha subunit [Leptomonas pyrrhocoris]|uniref:Protein farnesyltransferase/geranylgeranyltransferase type-1 subunit alpha n=1 Tax=Leptomonas pyrrhocoris TaxID=157538 RepID=A0A0M9G1Y2_LEPPY|nr:putative protein farnesyltransferase alpha subunit [Leptomonas pyrrhocoris]XP_015659022.1 putative protein farnesyltransferase alpha subunit [Leptomonas pyrrhocoris]KPA80582.1 putative protein farnesyltransferase alpha subunit [Leptomonas pyrrhocoris]KPA80583.1 putative protein farnesyltransferase alpha subunit [Leptomonas pyrrhocoris]|eukprot:XP_015659021.1 putative protein farnesyltransferase alpha subunit [Leptomonas pyrrhocoris]
MSAAPPDRSASSSSSLLDTSAHSLSSIDGDHLYQLACVETFLPLSKDVTPEEETTTSLHPVAHIDYSPNFKFIYGLYRALRSRVEYAEAVAQQRRGDHAGPIIRALHTSPARWLLLLGFTLRQCTSNYTVWKDRRDVIMSPDVLRRATRDRLPAQALPEVLLSSSDTTAGAAVKATALAEMKESTKKIELVAQNWLPGASDLFWNSDATAAAVDDALPTMPLSPWRAVRWELNAVGCFTRFYHKNFQVWHHRRELLCYALQQSTTGSPPAAHVEPNESSAAAAALKQSVQSLLESEEVFSAYLERHHGLRFADVDERATIKAVLGEEDSKNYHAWLHLSWYLHALPFLLHPPNWAALTAFTAAAQRPWTFRVHPAWAFASSADSASALPASRRPTLPPSSLTNEMDFTAQLLHRDCLNNSAWCHRYSLFKEDLLRRLWQEQQRPCFECGGGGSGGDGDSNTHVSEAEFRDVVHTLCMVEVDFALQWLYVDPTNESAYTHARSIATLFHTVAVRLAVLRGAKENAEGTGASVRGSTEDTPAAQELLRYLRDGPLCTPVAAAAADLGAQAGDDPVDTATTAPACDAVFRCMRHPRLAWSDYHDSFSVLRHVQRVLQTSIRQRVTELEGQSARVLRAAATTGGGSSSSSPSPASATSQKVALLTTLYERSSQYMLDNFHQVSTAQYLLCQAVLEEMWGLYLSAGQRCVVHQRRPPEAYREGIKSQWISCLPWESGEVTTEGDDKDEQESDRAVACFLWYEAAALDLAKRLSVEDPIRFKYWKFEAMNTMQRGYRVVL